MDGRGRWLDNVFIERLWRSLKYEAVYLHEIADGFAARRVNGEWLTFYNAVRPNLQQVQQQTETFPMEFGQPDQQPEYTLATLPTCPNDRDQFCVRTDADVWQLSRTKADHIDGGKL